MRDPKRIPIILEYIKLLWEKYPDQRLGQLLSNVTSNAMESNLYFYEDDHLLDHLYDELDKE
jgi:uncharacterized protein YihD (DUF1040 family)